MPSTFTDKAKYIYSSDYASFKEKLFTELRASGHEDRIEAEKFKDVDTAFGPKPGTTSAYCRRSGTLDVLFSQRSNGDGLYELHAAFWTPPLLGEEEDQTDTGEDSPEDKRSESSEIPTEWLTGSWTVVTKELSPCTVEKSISDWESLSKHSLEAKKVTERHMSAADRDSVKDQTKRLQEISWHSPEVARKMSQFASSA